MTEEPTATAESPAEPERVLLVDDNPTNLQVLFQTLDGRGYKLLIAKSGADALKIARKAKPQLVLLDIMMPGMDGYEVCRQLKADSEIRETAVIFLSALGETKDKVKGLELGAVDYITKPFQADEVIARVNTHLTIHRLKQSLARRNQQLQAANARMRTDLEAAAKVQRSLLPDAAPATERADFAWTYRPCDELAGDALNMFKIDERHIGVYVVDVSGHGVASALLAVSVSRNLSPQPGRVSLITEPGDGPDGHTLVSPSEVASRLNAMYPMDFKARLYFCLLYGIFDTQTRTLRFVSAGTPGPIRYRPGEGAQVYDVPATPIGLFQESEYEDTTLELQEGDRIYLHSDGVNEARNAAGEDLGRERMCAVLEKSAGGTLELSIDALISEAVRWRGSENLADDVALVAMEVR
ncbi:MAG: SpoIIE family protein phosphatase [Gammaproteobacteria bacterium]|nr:SpoIIE family protein phosphatase [Gammaproteobacteria bacterium]